MKVGKVIVAVLSIFLIHSFLPSHVFSQEVPSANGLVVKHRKPSKSKNKRYFDNNAKKKEIKTKTKILHGSMCPSFNHYISKPKTKRQKMLRKQRKKLS